ncbi:hypothetical protein PVAP13_2KG032132 [Panicum virgatum]|uniref:Alpha/beta hydrolase fold-3 domain-containing protein n=1 Tax=Panicum virgatum TaxID=38727 RepID=A0A8T0W8W0_PANVG|nr:hypothetical protein PVAP13_2KG032132 [Panicum virgatum]
MAQRCFQRTRVDWLWPFMTAGQASNDDPRLNPPEEEIASLTCRRVLVAVAEKDTLRERGCLPPRPLQRLLCAHCHRRRGNAGGVGGRGPRLPPLQPAARHQQEAHGEHRALHQPASKAYDTRCPSPAVYGRI